MLRELKLAVRALRFNPMLAAVITITLAIGIGATTAIFSVAEAVLWRPLPYTDDHRLVVATGEMHARGAVNLPLSGPDFLDLRAGATRHFQDFAAIQTTRTLYSQNDGTLEQVRIASVSPNLFRLLGGQIVMGRDFSDDDGEMLSSGEAAPREPWRRSTAAILSYAFWQRRYGGTPAVLGQVLANSSAQVVGILQPNFELLFPAQLAVERAPDIWFAARLPSDDTQRAMFSHRVVGKLQRGATLDVARSEVDGIVTTVRSRFPLWQTSDFHVRLEPFRSYLVAQVRPAIVAILSAAAGLVLIACANVANILIVRAAQRDREVAIRAALGGTRWQFIRQLLFEHLALAAAGTLIGVAVGWIALRGLLSVVPPGLPRSDDISINGIALAFAVLLGLVCAALFGIVPAFRGARAELAAVLRVSGRAAGGGRGRWLTNGVVIAQIAASFVLLVWSGLMLRSFAALQEVDPGFVARGLLTFELPGPRLDDPERRAALASQLRGALQAIPGVAAVTAATPFPLADRFSSIRWGTEEALLDATRFQAVDYQVVLPGYFEAMSTKLLAGRTFTEDDNAPSRSAVVVDELLARKAFPNEPAVGKRILVRIRTPQPEWVEIVGVVAHQRAVSLADLGREQIYFTDGFLGHGAANRWAIRIGGDAAPYEAAVRAAIAERGNHLVMADVHTMTSLVDRSMAPTRFALLLLGALAAAAALLSAVGVYGVLSNVVRERTPEMGVRMAMGAAPASILRLVAMHGLLLAGAGVALGGVAALSVTNVMKSILVGVEATDTRTLVTIALILLLIAAVASWLPGRRAARLNPTVALREP